MGGISKNNENVRFHNSGKFISIWANFIHFSAKIWLIQGKFTLIGRFSLKNSLDEIFKAKFNYNSHCVGEFFRFGRISSKFLAKNLLDRGKFTRKFLK
jgi:hypothetical protein